MEILQKKSVPKSVQSQSLFVAQLVEKVTNGRTPAPHSPAVFEYDERTVILD